MIRAILLAGAAVILSVPAFAQSPSAPQTAQPNAPAQQNSPAQNTPAPQNSPAPENTPAPGSASNTSPDRANAPSTADFIKNAAIAGMFEIQSSRLALRKHVAADQNFAKRMIRDHQRIGTELKRLVRARHVNAQVPNALDDVHKQMIDKLRDENGQAFDKDYSQMQQQGHEEAVTLFKNYSENGDNAALKKWAAKTLPELQSHLTMANKLS